MIRAKDIFDHIDGFAPFSSQMDGDNAGFLVGDEGAQVDAVLLTLDITPQAIEEAKAAGAQLIVSHHPIIFTPLRAVMSGDMAYRAAQSGISMICAHTNLDLADGGVNDCLAEKLGLENVRKAGDTPAFIRVGELPKPLSTDDFLKQVSRRLGCGGIKYTAPGGKIKTVAVCGGSGGGEWRYARNAGADAYVTANVKHNIFIDARREGFCIADAGHHCTENVVIEPLAKRLAEAFPELRTVISESSRDPADYFKE